MTEPILKADGLIKIYGGKTPVVQDVSFAVMPGRFVTIMGPSGCGKSTLLHMVSGLEPPSGGEATLAGQDLYGISERARTLLRRDYVGFVFQFYNLIPNLTAEENIRLPVLIGAGQPTGAAGGASAPAEERDGPSFEKLVEFFDLEKNLPQYPHELSGGEMQRVSIARALIARPAIVMADEPTGNISTSAGAEVMRLFRQCCDEFGQTILLVTHNPRDAAFSDEVHFLKDGRLHAEHSLADDAVTPENIDASLKALSI